MMCFLASAISAYGLGYIPENYVPRLGYIHVTLCPLVLTKFSCTTFAGDGSSLWNIDYFPQCLPSSLLLIVS